MRGYVYKITLNNNKSYIGMRISDSFNHKYMGSSGNKSYWVDLKKYGIKEHTIIDFFNINKRHDLELIESEYIKKNGIWPDSYNYYYFENNKRVCSLEKYEKLTKEEIKLIKIEYRKQKSDYIKEWKKTYYNENKDRLLGEMKDYYIKNKIYIDNRSNRYYLDNKDKWKKYSNTAEKKAYMKDYLDNYNNQKNEECMKLFGKSFSTISRRAAKEGISYKNYMEKYKNGGDYHA